jgi:hypothetical protein
MSVRAMLTGIPGPMTHMEFYLWQRYRLAQARVLQQSRKAPGQTR